MADKNIIRSQYLAARQKIDRHAANAAAMKLAGHLLDAVPVDCNIIAVYQPMRGEIDLAGALPELMERGHVLCLPAIVERDQPLIFRQWKPGEKLVAGAHGTQEPDKRAPQLSPDGLVAPLVAFDKEGYRIGYGAGYYDRTIAALKQQKPLLVIGAAFALQQVESIPHDAHDARMDMVVTENETIRFA